ncbi:MAG TPA: GAF domain-containing protein [Syntrophorhabdales bacterium]|nr:GAF domain-containing protein [Syntrophorhabdales bacterium]
MNPNRDRPPDAAGSGHNQDRKLRSLLQLGQLIGLDLQLDEMLLQIARKATEVMEADRFSIFLHDVAKDELFTTVALGMGRQEIRMAADSGIAGYCLKTGQTVSLDDAHADPRLNREAEAQTGYRTKTLLSMPFYSRAGRPLGVVQALNKMGGAFTEEDRVFLRMFNNHAAVFIEMAQLQKARIEALERSRSELERLNRAKTKAMNHVSHELKTPLAVIQGNVRLLKHRFEALLADGDWRECVDSVERHLKRLAEIQRETRQIFRVAEELEASSLVREMERFEQSEEHFSEMTGDLHVHWNAVKGWLSTCLSGAEQDFGSVRLYPVVERAVKNAEASALHRNIGFEIQGDHALTLLMNARIIREVLDGLIKNAVENTPDGGRIEIVLAEKERKVYTRVRDYGIGITEEDRLSLFDGLTPARETELYASKRPYEFGAGGKGLDLLRLKLYAERFGFALSVESARCGYIPSDREQCPGNILACGHCRTVDDCAASGGSTFTVAFPILSEPQKGA